MIKSICLIPARGGSKRIPKKNIKPFFGKPLIAWSIECALSSNLFSNVYVSTDSEDIASVAKEYGAKVPFKRPKHLSNDFAKDIDVREHFIKWAEGNGTQLEILCYLYPTAPFINKETLLGCYNLLLESDAAETFTITSYPYPPQRALKMKENEGLVFNWPEFKGKRSQDLNELYQDAGQCYFFHLSRTKKTEKRLGYRINRYLNQDIDTYEDFAIAEKLYRAQEIDL